LELYIKQHQLQLDEKFIEERAFFYKIIGDYYRYACETTTVKFDSQNAGSVAAVG
jgi:hypothetical protein